MDALLLTPGGLLLGVLLMVVLLFSIRRRQPSMPMVAELSVLEHLARHVGQVCHRDAILAALYPEDNLDASDERIDTLLRRLREALGEDGRNPRYLFTHRGTGIRLARGGVRE